ncbi:MAG: TIR domain-containing protein [Oscillospiraceae bacterium]|nr:TIR domain-containing protein [Oscillospiraceae bacterium]
MSVKISDEEFAKLLKEKADAGDPEFQFQVARSYDMGKSIGTNYVEMVKWLKLAVAQKHAGALNNLGTAYYHGEGVEKDLNEAVRLYKLSAGQGNAIAQYNLATCYEFGEGVSFNLEEALRLYKLSAEQGYWRAFDNLGRIYFTGVDVEQDLEKAKEYYEKAELNFDYWEDSADEIERERIRDKISVINEMLGKEKTARKAKRNEVFISYSHKDSQFRDEIEPFLKMLESTTEIKWWDDTKINSGEEWLSEIKKALARAKVAVILGSVNFFTSDFINKEELPKILEAASNDGATILWIPVSPFPYEDTVLKHYQALTSPETPLLSLIDNERYKIYNKLYKDIKNSFRVLEKV